MFLAKKFILVVCLQTLKKKIKNEISKFNIDNSQFYLIKPDILSIRKIEILINTNLYCILIDLHYYFKSN